MVTRSRNHRDSSSPEPGPAMAEGERHLRQLAAAAGHRSLARVAQLAPCDRHTIVAACRGEKTPIRAVVERIARVLHVDAKIVQQIFDNAGGRR